ELTVNTVQRIIDGTLTTTPQDSAGLDSPTPAPKIFKDTCHIDWNKTANEIHNLIRGVSPVPGAWTTLHLNGGDELTVKIFASVVTGNHNGMPGDIIIEGQKMIVVCGDSSSIEIIELQPAGKKRMLTSDYLRGARLENAR
ncbi:MAG: methionyl-tRNA formyltransferase, partial [Muribaculaceae bacterium]|nr:methionyl-tRNA formyltransferase [Muribaculaceae bacterium]